MLRPSQCIHYQRFDTLQLNDLRIIYRAKVREVGKGAYAVAHAPKARRVMAYDGCYLYAIDAKWLLLIYGVKLDDGNAAILILGEGVVEGLDDAICRNLVRVYMSSMYDRVVHKVEGTHVIDASRMVFVFVGKQYGVYMPHPLA